MRGESLRIIIIEDDENWRTALAGLYREVLEGTSLEIHESSDKADALRLLENAEWDLVSLDVDLRGDQKSVKGGASLAAYWAGQDVLQAIDQKGSTGFVIVVTGIAADERRPSFMPIPGSKEGLREQTITTLPVQLQSLFPGRSIFFQKNRHGDIARDVALMRKQLLEEQIRKSILEACGAAYRLQRMSPKIWRIVFDGRTVEVSHDPALLILGMLFDHPGEPIGLGQLDRAIGMTRTWHQPEEREEGEEDDVDEIPHQGKRGRSGFPYEDFGGSGMSKREHWQERTGRLSVAVRAYEHVRDSAESDEEECERDDRLKRLEDHLRYVERLPERYITMLREGREFSDSELKRLGGWLADADKKVRDRNYRRIVRFLKGLKKDFRELWEHLAPEREGGKGSLVYIRGCWKYLPNQPHPVRWEVKPSAP